MKRKRCSRRKSTASSDAKNRASSETISRRARNAGAARPTRVARANIEEPHSHCCAGSLARQGSLFRGAWRRRPHSQVGRGGDTPGRLGGIRAAGASIDRRRSRVGVGDAIAEEIVSTHVRASMGDHRSTSAQPINTRKAVVRGKLDFSPPVQDFATIGFPLVGGRLGVCRGHAAAGLVLSTPETRD